MDNNGFKEKRSFPRFPVSIPVALMDPSLCGQIIGAQTKDISVCGIGIITERKITPGINIYLCLRMNDNGEEINLKGKAVWVTVIDPERYRAGIKLEGCNLKPIPLVLRILQFRQS